MDSERDCGRYIPRMASSAMRALKTSLVTLDFAPAYLFHGDNEFLKEEKVRALIERATDVATRDFNLEVRRASEMDSASLAVALDSLPMMAARRVLVIREIATLKKDSLMLLKSHLERPTASIVLLLIASAGTKPDAALSQHCAVVEFKSLNENELVIWLSQHAASVGVTIQPTAAELLCRTTGNDLALLAGEIDKLRSYANGAPIDERAVTAVVGVRHGETLGDLLDLLAVRDGPGGIMLVGRTLAQPKTTAVSILMALTTQTLALGWALAARARGLPQHQLERELFGLLKETPSSLVGRPWGEAVKAWVRALRHWDSSSVDHALELLIAADAALKDSRVSSEEQILSTLLLSISADNSRRAAA
jgi:DNA polymerase III subunit delta